ncbi:hypothetical protein XENTR_v10016329 [Xenopus tropicalis]|nr:hypothetical protein XENTR_v10016329 [Xenopus tropicalis]
MFYNGFVWLGAINWELIYQRFTNFVMVPSQTNGHRQRPKTTTWRKHVWTGWQDIPGAYTFRGLTVLLTDTEF